MRLALELEDAGAISAAIAYAPPQVSVSIWAEQPETSRILRDNAGLLDDATLGREILGAARGQHHGRTGREPPGDLDADLAASTENHDHLASGARLVRRVCHGSDYHLR